VECCPILEFADLTKFQFDPERVVEHIDDKKNDNFRSLTLRLDIIRVFFLPTDAQER
jgi:hypothetical protein